MRSCLVILLAGIMAAGAVSCSNPAAPSPDLRGGVVATFAVSGEQFNVFVTNAQTIAQLFALRNGTGTATIPSARIHRGAGAGNHNAPYTWYLDPADIEMASATIELCDGRPSYVEDNVGEYVDVVKRYCPWGATLVKLADYR